MARGIMGLSFVLLLSAVVFPGGFRPGPATNQTDAGIAIVLLPVPAMPTMLAGNYW